MASLAEKAPEDAPIEISMFKAPECFLYKVPPLKIASGHRAEDWGLGSPQLTGRVEIVGVGTTAEVRVFKQDDGAKPVAVCPVRCAAGSSAVGAVVDDVVDSSRYFVLRLEDAKKRKAYLGLGFRERDVAYDFKATLCDFKRSVDREEKAEADHADYERRQADGADPEPEVDMSLKGRIKISLGDDDGDRPAAERERARRRRGAAPRAAAEARAPALAAAARAAARRRAAAPGELGDLRRRPRRRRRHAADGGDDDYGFGL
ncbi:hypothetical protein JL722_4187 [Aureococcus anophagefferens]|nr:hypothetical protein JL722_4187 [Aureococcus anophagefferens]